LIVTEWVSGNVFIRSQGPLKKGTSVAGHKHNFDHTTIVFKGSVHVRGVLPNGNVIERDFAAPAHFLVKADVEHQITALESDTIYWCVYSHRTPQGVVVQEYTGWSTAHS
jgi:hypothetical protein